MALAYNAGTEEEDLRGSTDTQLCVHVRDSVSLKGSGWCLISLHLRWSFGSPTGTYMCMSTHMYMDTHAFHMPHIHIKTMVCILHLSSLISPLHTPCVYVCVYIYVYIS